MDRCVWPRTSTCKSEWVGTIVEQGLKIRFNAVRVPTSPADIPLAYPPAENHHIVVVRNNRYFKVDTQGRGKKDLAEAFKQVKEMADGKAGPGVGVLTGDDRDVWAEVSGSSIWDLACRAPYLYLLSTSQNRTVDVESGLDARNQC